VTVRLNVCCNNMLWVSGQRSAESTQSQLASIHNSDHGQLSDARIGADVPNPCTL
jgi:hypothetical protein